MSIKHKLVIAVVLVLAVLSVLQTWQQVSNLDHNVQQNLEHQAKQLSTTAATQLSIWLDNKLKTLKAVTDKTPKNSDFQQELFQTQKAGGFSNVFYGNEQGNMVAGDPNYEIPYGYDPRIRIWYVGATQHSPYLSEPYTDTNGNLVMTLALQSANGVYASDLPLTTIKTQLKALSTRSIVAFLVSSDGTILVYPDPKWVEHGIHELSKQLSGKVITKYQGKLIKANLNKIPSLISFSAIPNTDWFIGLSFNKQKAFASVHEKLVNSLLYNAITFVFVALVMYLLIEVSFRPLKQLQNAITALGQGDSDLTQRLNLKRSDEIGKLGQSFDIFLDRLHQLLQRVNSDSVKLLSNAEKVSEYASHSSQSAMSQQQQITDMTNSFNEITDSALHVAENATQTSVAVQDSQKACIAGKTVIERNQEQILALVDQLESTASGLAQLEQSSTQINDILTTIQGIAEQTNLLALNAAIEAARAGEQGRGFAVVAGEVRDLSQRTQQSTEQIRDVLSQLHKNTQHTVKTMQDSRQQAQKSVEEASAATDALDNINNSIQSIQDMAAQISSAADQQHHATLRMRDNSSAIQQDCSMLQAHAGHNDDKAQDLKQIARRLNHEMNQFTL
ncbi:MAG: Methyl-accepting chemotaxis protein PctB [Candidatus Celerinatantimonas neptuna]|nr:MAG: Methyl-accepting chemotaxis protein PctB [Candidatus Celerinatantimonas neptuna]